jgi:hypothetical protein
MPKDLYWHCTSNRRVNTFPPNTIFRYDPPKLLIGSQKRGAAHAFIIRDESIITKNQNPQPLGVTEP